MMLEHRAEAKLSGRFILKAGKADGSGERTLADFTNMVLDSGLDLLFTGASGSGYYGYAYVIGNGTLPEAPEQTALVSPFASVMGAINSGRSFSMFAGADGAPYRIEVSQTKRFPAGQAQGVISEVGTGPGVSLPLFSRALVRDAEGNPTTIEVLSDEYLDMTYVLTVHVDVTDKPFTLNLSSGAHDGVLRPARMLSAPSGNFLSNWLLGSVQGGAGSVISTGGLGPVEGRIGGTSAAAIFSVVESSEYTPGSFYRDATLEYGLTTANQLGEAGISAINTTFTHWHEYQMSFDPPIPKTPQRIFRIKLRVSLARA